MKYENAKDILPQELLREVQRYISGAVMYVPSGGERKPWGEVSGYKSVLTQRNRDIRNKFVEGATADELAEQFFLSPDTIRKIVYTRKETYTMKKLPERIPDYTIERSDKPVPAVKCESLRGWDIIPRIGESASFARYVSPQKMIRDIVDLKVIGTMEIHGIDGVRIEVHERSTEYQPDSYDTVRYLTAQLTESHTRILAEQHEEDGVVKLTTFMDGDAFLACYGCGEDNIGRKIILEPAGNMTKDGNIITVRTSDPFFDIVGRYNVAINGNVYDTVLVVDTESLAEGIVTEEYIDLSGKSVLFRRYNRNDWRYEEYGKLWEEILPDADRIFVNGECFVHWVDSVTEYIV